MDKVVIFGTGKHWTNHKRLLREVEIIAFADNDQAKVGKMYEGKPIIHPNKLPELQFDKVMIASVAKDQMIHQLFELKVAARKIELLNCYRLIDSLDFFCEVMEDQSVRYRIGGITFTCRTRSDFNVVQELYDDGDYNFHSSHEQYYVVDIGMNIGLASLYFAGQANITKVYGFEPFTSTYQQAIENIRMNESAIREKIETIQCGLGACGEHKYFSYNENFSGGMSTMGQGEEQGEDVVEVIIEDAVSVLTPIIKKQGTEKGILKIDCEGSEYEIIKALNDSHLLNSFSIIMMEWHIPQKNPMLRKILDDNEYRYFEFAGNDTRGFIYAIR